ncbi:uncharacterized protein LOC131874444 [Cryptomeria japonica]|uniref:uncharacterized protein LOC131874444 n=1 Tax=Cryptomeria japonica TaxID=3369 RepID=UPI0027DA044A|nr:uncharacterized protein LOC131874444 [Cryptomeria japonica]
MELDKKLKDEALLVVHPVKSKEEIDELIYEANRSVFASGHWQETSKVKADNVDNSNIAEELVQTIETETSTQTEKPTQIEEPTEDKGTSTGPPKTENLVVELSKKLKEKQTEAEAEPAPDLTSGKPNEAFDSKGERVIEKNDPINVDALYVEDVTSDIKKEKRDKEKAEKEKQDKQKAEKEKQDKKQMKKEQVEKNTEIPAQTEQIETEKQTKDKTTSIGSPESEKLAMVQIEKQSEAEVHIEPVTPTVLIQTKKPSKVEVLGLIPDEEEEVKEVEREKLEAEDLPDGFKIIDFKPDEIMLDDQLDAGIIEESEGPEVSLMNWKGEEFCGVNHAQVQNRPHTPIVANTRSKKCVIDIGQQAANHQQQATNHQQQAGIGQQQADKAKQQQDNSKQQASTSY